MGNPLEKEFQYYLDHQDDLVKQYNGKVIVIKNGQVIGVYESEIEAIEKTSEKEELGTFLVQKCNPGTDNYVQMYHSRVAFV
jgi:hypothetical protein